MQEESGVEGTRRGRVVVVTRMQGGLGGRDRMGSKLGEMTTSIESCQLELGVQYNEST